MSMFAFTAFVILSLKDKPPILASSPRLAFFCLIYFVFFCQNYDFLSSLYLDRDFEDYNRSSFYI